MADPGMLRLAANAVPLPLDGARVRIHGSAGAGVARLVRRVVLRLSRGRAVALGNHVFLPARCEHDPAVLAHELTHCAQYQAWGAWRYYGRGAAAQLRDVLHRSVGLCGSPYAYRLEGDKPFLAYGMEQQAQMVEDRLRQRLGGGRAPGAVSPRRPPAPLSDRGYRAAGLPRERARCHRGRPPGP